MVVLRVSRRRPVRPLYAQRQVITVRIQIPKAAPRNTRYTLISYFSTPGTKSGFGVTRLYSMVIGWWV